jgi:peptidyl-prolyl cis-trans isomerase SurA
MRRFTLPALLLLVFATGICTTASAQGKAAAKQRKPLIQFENGGTVYKDEFEYVFQKNNGGYADAATKGQAAYRDYLDLYIKFRRKVMDAEAQGIDTTRAFQQELAGYLKQLAQPYLIEKEVLNDMIAEAHRRSQAAMKVSHILVNVPRDASPADTLAAYQRALAVRKRVVEGGEDFAAVAQAESEDPSARQNQGYLSWFSVFDFVYPFESAAYGTPVGKVSAPIRTDFGYHLIKVHDRMDVTGMRTVRHLLVRWGKIYAAKDSLAAVARVYEAYQKLRTGSSWDEVAAAYSDDPNTKDRGGNLGDRYIGVPALQDRKYTQVPGELSQPFTSPYGYHVMVVEGPEAAPSLEQVRADFKARVSRDARAKIAEQELIDRLKRQYSFSLNEATLNELKQTAKPDYQKPDYPGTEISETLRAATLFSFAGQQATVEDLLAQNAQNRGRSVSRLTLEKAIDQDVAELAKDRLMGYEEQQLAKRYPEFGYLMQEYRDGILLFTVTEQKVWRRAVEDSAGLAGYYTLHRDKYQGGQRVRMMEYLGPDSSELKKVVAKLQQTGRTDSANAYIVLQQLNVRSSELIFSVEKAATADYAAKPVGYMTEPEKQDNQWSFFYLMEHIPPGPKTLEEARSEVISDYQNQLEQAWLDELAKRYPATVNEKVLGKLYN